MRIKLSNPLYHAIFTATGVSVSFTAYERKVDENCARMRSFVRDYVRKRKQGAARSSLEKGSDLLSLFFESPEVFTEDFIIDELFDFFAAAQATTQNAA